jgi:hypothetical protein
MNRELLAIGLSIVAGIVTTLIFAYMKGEWPFER